jgi:hypothetical protein
VLPKDGVEAERCRMDRNSFLVIRQKEIIPMKEKTLGVNS